MQTWKKIIFMNAIKTRVKNSDGTADEIINSYSNLTENEKAVLKAEFSK